jgi:hypothetical protein
LLDHQEAVGDPDCSVLAGVLGKAANDIQHPGISPLDSAASQFNESQQSDFDVDDTDAYCIFLYLVKDLQLGCMYEYIWDV